MPRRTGDAWHVELRNLKNVESLTYGWRADASDISRFYPGAPRRPRLAERGGMSWTHKQIGSALWLADTSLLQHHRRLQRRAHICLHQRRRTRGHGLRRGTGGLCKRHCARGEQGR